MNRNIEGKVVIITGASSGLGESTARRLGKLGATIVLGARRKDRLNSIVKDIQADGGKALAVAVATLGNTAGGMTSYLIGRDHGRGRRPGEESHQHIR